jgi:hypothetical protein
MKKQILSEEFTRMQKLAGIITESKLLNEVILKISEYDPSSYKLIKVQRKNYPSEEEAKKAAVAHNWQIAWDNDHTDLSKEEYVNKYSWEDLDDIFYSNFGYEIID